MEVHCHLGLDGYGIGFEGADYNEVTDSLTSELSAIEGRKALPCGNAFGGVNL